MTRGRVVKLEILLDAYARGVRRAMAENKTKPTEKSVVAFVDSLPEQVRRTDAKALIKLMTGASGEKAKMWGPSIIGFGTYRYKYESGREGDTVLVGFSPRKAARASTPPSRSANCRRRG